MSRILQTKEQKFIALVKSFRNEIINEEENKNYIKYMRNFIPKMV